MFKNQGWFSKNKQNYNIQIGAWQCTKPCGFPSSKGYCQEPAAKMLLRNLIKPWPKEASSFLSLCRL